MRNNLFRFDLYRYYGGNRRSVVQVLFPAYEIKYIKWLRRTQVDNNFINRIRLRKISKYTHIQIPPQCKIGPGFQILHFGRIIFNHHVEIGSNCTVCPGVLIGQEEREGGARKGNPIIGNNVFIGANSSIVGKVRIGNNVIIAPNSYINFDVPDNSIVIGNPGKIISRENASDGYIKNPIDLNSINYKM